MKFSSSLAIVFILDIVVIGLHLLFGKEAPLLNLDGENTLPAIYSSLKLALVGSVAFIIFFIGKKKFLYGMRESFLWVTFGLLFLYLSFDEFFSLHERTIEYLKPSFLLELGWFSNSVFYWVLLFSPLIALTLMMFYVFMKSFFKEYNKLFLLGVISFSMVIVLEFIGGLLEGEIGYSVMTLEESFEIFGTSFFLVSLLMYRDRMRKHTKKEFLV